MRAERSLKSPRDFDRVLRSGRRASSGGLSVHAAPRPGGGASRLGLVVRSRAGAVGRNRIKRRLRSAWETTKPSDGYDVVVRAGEELDSRAFAELSRDLSVALGHAMQEQT